MVYQIGYVKDVGRKDRVRMIIQRVRVSGEGEVGLRVARTDRMVR